jgi:4-carboxymuconolactone decarboxylase
MTDKRATARHLMERMMGPGFADAIEGAERAGGFGAPMAGLAIEHAFADVWARPGLSLRDRSLVVIAVLIAQGQRAELKNHIKFGINNGLTPEEIEEALIQAYPYVGFPATSTALSAAIEILRAMGVDTNVRTGKENGLF